MKGVVDYFEINTLRFSLTDAALCMYVPPAITERAGWLWKLAQGWS